ncbi:ecdysteroid-regulated 16 kDa protein-like [Solenopsis invicta]|uniref:ecdysteroid-regulated 16 kDa protein-like n=1 Tax=Solenopsis invicta TaxID=13686 RepID=UPI000595D555|nr:ecdysteroid-regulated 16 kDa protein-like [Solenopsis invicta]
MSVEKCIYTRGSKVDIVVKFLTSKDVLEVIVKAFAVMLDVLIPLPIEKPNICNDPKGGLSCSIKKDQEVQYKTSLTVEKKIPPMSVDFVWEFRNENDEKILCQKFPLKIV